MGFSLKLGDACCVQNLEMQTGAQVQEARRCLDSLETLDARMRAAADNERSTLLAQQSAQEDAYSTELRRIKACMWPARDIPRFPQP